jgi:hypothetical protein
MRNKKPQPKGWVARVREWWAQGSEVPEVKGVKLPCETCGISHRVVNGVMGHVAARRHNQALRRLAKSSKDPVGSPEILS